MYKYKYFSTHLQVFKQKVNLDNTSLYTYALRGCPGNQALLIRTCSVLAYDVMK